MSRTCDSGNAVAERHLRERAAVLEDQLAPLYREDEDAVHDMRVGSRRLRVCLKYHAQAWRKAPRKVLFERVRAVTRALGPARELDVSLGILAELAESGEGAVAGGAKVAQERLRTLRAEQSAQVQRAAAFVESPDFRASLEGLLACQRPERPCYVKKGRKKVRKAFKKLKKTFKKWRKDASGERLHRVRVAFKKFRYVCELAAHLYGEDFQDLIGQSKQAQKDLGKWNDYRVLRNYVRTHVPGDEPTALIGELERRMDGHYRDFKEHAPAFFEGSSPEAIRQRIKHPRFKCGERCEAARILEEWEETREPG